VDDLDAGRFAWPGRPAPADREADPAGRWPAPSDARTPDILLAPPSDRGEAGADRGAPTRNERIDAAVAQRTLADDLEQGPLGPARAVTLLTQVADALDAAHRRGVVHPAIEPAAIAIHGAGGLRAAVTFPPSGAERPPLPPDGPSPALQYAAPEQATGHPDPRSNVYSLAALLFHCLTGRVPFPEGRDRALLFWHLHAPRPVATQVRPSLHAAIDGVLARGMATDAAARQPTARSLLDEAAHALRDPSPTAPGSAHAAADADADAPPKPESRPLSEAEAPPDAVEPPASVPSPEAEPAAPSREPETPSRGATQPARRPPRRRARRVGAVALAVAAGVAGFAAPGVIDSSPGPSTSARAGALELAVPPGWARRGAQAIPAGIGLNDPLVLAPAGDDAGRLVAGMATPTASVALLAALRASPRSGEPVFLGRGRARRYRAARPSAGNGPSTVYLAPTDRGIATIACLPGSVVAAAFDARCERVAGSLLLTDGRFLPVGPSDQQATAVAAVFRRLNTANATYRSRLARSRTPGAQGAAAAVLARADTREAAALQSLRLKGLAEPGSRAAIQALKRAAAAHRAVDQAARRRDRRGYAAARRAVLMTHGQIRAALEALRMTGFAG
jgi:hypothetical protein